MLSSEILGASARFHHSFYAAVTEAAWVESGARKRTPKQREIIRPSGGSITQPLRIPVKW